LLAAISCGAVFMGANTYIGNGPNFMVRAIAESAGVKMPSFFGYMAYSGLILLPVFVVVTFLLAMTAPPKTAVERKSCRPTNRALSSSCPGFRDGLQRGAAVNKWPTNACVARGNFFLENFFSLRCILHTTAIAGVDFLLKRGLLTASC
jgi:hypothetical protein